MTDTAPDMAQIKLGMIRARTLLMELQQQVYSAAPTVRMAVRFATNVHRHDIRHGLNGEVEPYIVHPLRNTLHLLSWGVRDEHILAAELLHDTLEKHAHEIANVDLDMNEEAARIIALGTLTDIFGADIADLVENVSNPIFYGGPARMKQEAYLAHVSEVIEEQRTFLVKAGDFTDNAGNVVPGCQDRERALKLAAKYAPLVPLFQERVAHIHDIFITDAGRVALSDRLYQIGDTLDLVLAKP